MPAPARTDAEILDAIKKAVTKAGLNYQEFHEGKNVETTDRGFKSGIFTKFRHLWGATRANDLNDKIHASTTAADAIKQLDEILTNPKTRYNNHSFGSYLLDEIAKVADYARDEKSDVPSDILDEPRTRLKYKYLPELNKTTAWEGMKLKLLWGVNQAALVLGEKIGHNK